MLLKSLYSTALLAGVILRHHTPAWGGWGEPLDAGVYRMFVAMQSSSGEGGTLTSLVRAKREYYLLLECNEPLSACAVPVVLTC